RAAQRLTQPKGQEPEDEPWERRHIEGGSPAETAGHDASTGKADRDADRGAGRPDRHCPCPSFLLEVVAEQGGARRVVARFANPQHRASAEELQIVASQPGEKGG